VRSAIYLPYLQAPAASLNLIVRTASDPAGISAAVRKEVWALDEELPLSNVITMRQLLLESFWRTRLYTLLLGAFAVVALVLATGGIYGVISYSVAQRTHEIGVRLALGARAPDVLRLVIGQGMRLTVIGVAMGLAVAFALTRVMSNLLYGVSAGDPMTFSLVSLLLAAVAGLASYLPARRATKVDPMVALRHE
jgi:putative ABC transport system permease protein